MDDINKAVLHKAALRIALHIDQEHREFELFDRIPAYVLHRVINGTLERVLTLVQKENPDELTLAFLKALTEA
jgi:hypothetical protein